MAVDVAIYAPAPWTGGDRLRVVSDQVRDPPGLQPAQLPLIENTPSGVRHELTRWAADADAAVVSASAASTDTRVIIRTVAFLNTMASSSHELVDY